MIWLGLVVGDDFGTNCTQQGYKDIMLLLGYSQVWPAGIVPGDGVIYGEGVVWALDQHRTQRRNHALTTIEFCHFTEPSISFATRVIRASAFVSRLRLVLAWERSSLVRRCCRRTLRRVLPAPAA